MSDAKGSSLTALQGPQFTRECSGKLLSPLPQYLLCFFRLCARGAHTASVPTGWHWNNNPFLTPDGITASLVCSCQHIFSRHLIPGCGSNNIRCTWLWSRCFPFWCCQPSEYAASQSSEIRAWGESYMLQWKLLDVWLGCSWGMKIFWYHQWLMQKLMQISNILIAFYWKADMTKVGRKQKQTRMGFTCSAVDHAACPLWGSQALGLDFMETGRWRTELTKFCSLLKGKSRDGKQYRLGQNWRNRTDLWPHKLFPRVLQLGALSGTTGFCLLHAFCSKPLSWTAIYFSGQLGGIEDALVLLTANGKVGINKQFNRLHFTGKLAWAR